MRKGSFGVLSLSLAAVLFLVGCGRTKELERQNREQARVIADLNQQMTGMQDELAQSKAQQGARVQGGTAAAPQRSYIK